MASDALCALCGLIIAAVTHFHAVSAQKSLCGNSEFWNSDLDVCVPCSSCKQYPKTPSCNTCKPVEDSSDMWKLAAIASFSVLAVVLVSAALIIGVMVHRRTSHTRPLRVQSKHEHTLCCSLFLMKPFAAFATGTEKPIEETAGPLYQA